VSIVGDRNGVLTELQASQLWDEVRRYRRCPEREYEAKGVVLAAALADLGWPECGECGDLATVRFSDVTLCETCHSASEQDAWTGVLHDVLKELGPAGRRRLQDFLHSVLTGDTVLDEAMTFAFGTELVIDPPTREGEFPRPFTHELG